MPPRHHFIGLNSWQGLLCVASAAFLAAAMGIDAQGEDATGRVRGRGARAFNGEVKPLVRNYCLKCHSTEKHKGDINLEQFVSAADVFKHPKPWERALEQLASGDMPPKEKPQPSAAERQRLIDGVNAMLDAVALTRAGDPGPVV